MRLKADNAEHAKPGVLSSPVSKQITWRSVMRRRNVSSELSPGEKARAGAASALCADSPKASTQKRGKQKRAAPSTQLNGLRPDDDQRTASAIAVLLVAPRLLIREGIARILVPHFSILESVSNIDDVAPNVFLKCESLLLIIDASGDMEAAIAQMSEFKARVPAGRIAVISEGHQVREMVLALRTGANAFVRDIEDPDAFVKSLELVMCGETILRQGILSHILEYSPLQSPPPEHPNQITPATSHDMRALRLSERQQDILRYLAKGATNRIIARRFDVDVVTVKSHVRAVLQKIRAQNRTQAAVWALKRWNDLQRSSSV
ncbi:MAG: response regulator transcription factor [Hyphomicrobiales bacterium]|nr:response regulator transcription factor [Hyphomicrobiales bacterium]